jgi:hypothetical protein
LEEHTVSRFKNSLKMEVVCSSETLVSTYKSARRENSKDKHRRLHHREKIKYHGTGILSEDLLDLGAV